MTHLCFQLRSGKKMHCDNRVHPSPRRYRRQQSFIASDKEQPTRHQARDTERHRVLEFVDRGAGERPEEDPSSSR